MKLTSYRSTCTARGLRPPQLKFNNLLNAHFPSYFFKSILCVKTGEVEVNRYWKIVQKMVTLTKHVIPGPDLHCAVPLALRGFLQHLPAKYKWRPKKSYYLRAGPWHCTIWQIRRWLFRYVHKKFRWGPEVATFKTKNLISPWSYI